MWRGGELMPGRDYNCTDVQRIRISLEAIVHGLPPNLFSGARICHLNTKELDLPADLHARLFLVRSLVLQCLGKTEEPN